MEKLPFTSNTEAAVLVPEPLIITPEKLFPVAKSASVVICWFVPSKLIIPPAGANSPAESSQSPAKPWVEAPGANVTPAAMEKLPFTSNTEAAVLVPEPLIITISKLFPVAKSASVVICWSVPSKVIVLPDALLKVPFASVQSPATVWSKPPSRNVAVDASSKLPSISKAPSAVLFPALVNFKLL